MKTQHNILICDDNEFIRTALSVFIDGMPEVSYDLASDGQEGFNCILEHDYDLIIMDMQMPIFSGMELVRYIREAQVSDVPIIILTGHMNDEMYKSLAHFNVHSIFIKPFAPREIKAAVIENLQVNEPNYHI